MHQLRVDGCGHLLICEIALLLELKRCLGLHTLALEAFLKFNISQDHLCRIRCRPGHILKVAHYSHALVEGYIPIECTRHKPMRLLTAHIS